MSLYIIEDRYGALRDSSVNYNYAKALQQSRYPGCHIVELVPAKPKVQVSHEEAEMLERAKASGYPVSAISGWCDEGEEDHTDVEDRLMRAYVNGWTVANPKRWNVKVPHTKDVWYYNSWDKDLLTVSDKERCSEFTEAEIEQYGLKDCIKEEVTNDEQQNNQARKPIFDGPR